MPALIKGLAMDRSAGRIRLFYPCVLFFFSCFLYSQSPLQVGYSLLTAEPGSHIPVGTALFTYTNAEGILVSQAGVAAAEPILSGRIFVDETGAQTGIALVNVSTQGATVNLVLRDSSGTEVSRKSITLGAGRHLPTFVFQQFPGLPAGFTGSLTFESDLKLAAITLRQSQNRNGDPLYTTLPVVDLAAPANQNPVVFPQIAAGDGYVTQLILINTSGQRLTGKVRFKDDAGTLLPLNLNGEVNSEFAYQIEPQGTYRAELDRLSGLGVGYAVVTPDSGMVTPSGSAVFQFKSGAYVVTEAGVGASPATSLARIFVDNVASYTGVAIASTDSQPAEVFFTLLDSAGFSIQTVSRTLPPGGHIAIFAHELFPGLADTFTGLMEIRSQNPVNPITLKLTINQRNEQVLTTLPVADLTRPPSATSAVFPQIAIGAGFSTRLIFINASTDSATSGRLGFWRSDATAMTIPLAGISGSQFNYQLTAGGGRQYFPGSSATAARIVLVDPATNAPSSEVVVNEGSTVHPRVLVFDSSGTPRDDFDTAYASISPDIAAIDANGVIQGKAAGFSTFTVTSGGVIATGTITVVSISSAVTGFEITGIAQDLARRLYLANSADQTIMLAQDLSQAPEIYAGVPKNAGLKNDVRLQSLFSSPGSLAFNQAQGILYVSDPGNNAIRTVQPGPSGRVSTLVGGLNSPGGVALDNRGNLWVADSGSHTIRRISLVSGTIATIAGQAGSSGWVDGEGANARFSSPAGIALETEPLAAQLERAMKGLPTPPVSLLVADAGNGVVRRVKETGEVETIGASTAGSPSFHAAAAAAGQFSAPSGIAVDPLGNIYVSEPAAGRVRVILRTGEIVPAAQAGTFAAPTGLAIGLNGKIVVGERSRPVRQISYGEPQITSVTPDRAGNNGGTRVTIKGRNFAPDSQVVAGGAVISAADITDTQTISFTLPALPSGLGILTVQNRAGLAQTNFTVDPVPLDQLPRGYVTTVAGGSTFGGEGSSATAVSLTAAGVAIDPAGNVLIADGENHRVRRIDSKSRTIVTVAGNGQETVSGDGGPAVAAGMRAPVSLSLDGAGNLYIADLDGQRIRKVDASTGIMSTVAGGNWGYCGDGGQATDACFDAPFGVAADAAGSLFIADYFNNRIRKVDAKTGIITTLAGTGQPAFSGDGGPADSAALNSPEALAVDESARALYIADAGNNRVRKVDLATNVITTVAGGGNPAEGLGDNLPATSAALENPWGVAVDSAGNLFIADRGNCKIRRVDGVTGIITTVAGNGRYDFSGDGGPATDAAVNEPWGIAADGAGNIVIADAANRRVRKVDSNGIITTIAGNGQATVLGDDLAATAAILREPFGVAFDGAGNLWITDRGHERIRKVDAATKIITTVVGSSSPEPGDGGPAAQAGLGDPVGAVVFDRGGNLFLADTGHNSVRKVYAVTKIITTIAGTGDEGLSGDGGPAAKAALNTPERLALDVQRNLLYITDTGNRRIRKVDLADGTIDTVRGIVSGTTAAAPILGLSISVATDAAGNLFIGQMIEGTETGVVLRVDIASQAITTVAGGGSSYEEGIPATAAQLLYPMGIAVDSGGNLFILNYPPSVRRVDAATGKIATVAGEIEGVALSGDNGPARGMVFNYPRGIALDSLGNLFIADTDNHRIRAVRGPFN